MTTPSETLNTDSATALLYDMTDIMRVRFNLSEPLASIMAEQVVAGCREKWGSQEIYIPAPDKSARDAAIRREFNGRNRDEICRRYGIGKSRLYEILGG